MTQPTLTTRALNRALLARQSLLERAAGTSAVELVGSIGALQAQYWPAPPVALWSRLADFDAAELYAALAERRLVTGTLLRATLHLVTARDHPAYAVATDASGATAWRRTGDRAPLPELERLRAQLPAFAAAGVGPRTAEEITAFVEAHVARLPAEAAPEEEVAWQREHGWRPFRGTVTLVRAPEDGEWGPGKPEAYLPGPGLTDPPDPEEALREVIRRHLRAFGPAAPDDVAQWIGWRTTPVKAALADLADELVCFREEGGGSRPLYDLPDAPRPPEDTPAPVRLLPWFDSLLLAYAPARRGRVLPEAHRAAVYAKANLQVRPTFLVDGMVAGTWSLERRGRRAALTLRPLEPLTPATRRALLDEAERLVHFCRPDATAHDVTLDE
ncbi:winged helix DNA-binding domain-containing protein [Allostreptomyces psammosilenae]|uniref:Winged helix DNA-binding domain-containing protein n=1 Tax=Allostreptomyces psammosilenae TaxID=1892865 RepID=A0A853A6Q0_9ACTN|nr:winged helix DNA-binding domain-containing protein [Allostreptomyces psammosilenae]NYI06218.1 hypothetical protein [Allostreptomyces psammosilenae]